MVKKEQIAIIDGQMTVFDVLEDIEKNGLSPRRFTDCGGDVCGGELGSTCDACSERMMSDGELAATMAVNHLHPKPLWNR